MSMAKIRICTTTVFPEKTKCVGGASITFPPLKNIANIFLANK